MGRRPGESSPGQLCEGLEAGLGGHQATQGLELTLQLSVGSCHLRFLGQQRQDGIVDQLLLVLREQALEPSGREGAVGEGSRREKSNIYLGLIIIKCIEHTGTQLKNYRYSAKALADN